MQDPSRFYKSSWKRRIHGLREAHTGPSSAPPAWIPAAVRTFSPAPNSASERLVGRASVMWSRALVFRSVQRVGSTGAFSDSIPSRLKRPPGKPFASVSGHRAAVLQRTIWERRVVERRFRAFSTSPVRSEVSGDDLVVEAEQEDLDDHAASPSGPIARVQHDRATFSGTWYPTPLLPPKTVSGSDQGGSRGLYLRGPVGARGRVPAPQRSNPLSARSHATGPAKRVQELHGLSGTAANKEAQGHEVGLREAVLPGSGAR